MREQKKKIKEIAQTDNMSVTIYKQKLHTNIHTYIQKQNKQR